MENGTPFHHQRARSLHSLNSWQLQSNSDTLDHRHLSTEGRARRIQTASEVIHVLMGHLGNSMQTASCVASQNSSNLQTQQSEICLITSSTSGNTNISNLQTQRSEIRFITSSTYRRHTHSNMPLLLGPYPCSE